MSLATPPYYMVSFTSKLNSDIASDEYTQVADLMVSLAKQQPGFLDLSQHATPQAKLELPLVIGETSQAFNNGNNSLIINWPRN